MAELRGASPRDSTSTTNYDEPASQSDSSSSASLENADVSLASSESSEISSDMLTKLLETPLTISPIATTGALTPGTENTILRCVDALVLESPQSPRGQSFKRPLQPLMNMLSPLTSNNRSYSKEFSTNIFKRARILKPVKAFDFSKPLYDENSTSEAELAEGVSVVDKEEEDLLNDLPILPMFKNSNNNNPIKFSRSHSESAVSIMKAVEQSGNDPLLVGDCSKRYLLPIIPNGKHNDLKEISTDTLVSVLKGDYNNELASFQVIDCRYPYEFDGGHIQGAVNLYTQKQMQYKYLNKHPLEVAVDKRNILIFHCEFSSQRAPNMCRFLRDIDRNLNKESYPALHHPEMYILHNGYKAFFENQPSYCSPSVYVTMIDPTYSQEFSFFKSKTKEEMIKAIGSMSCLPPQRKTKSFNRLCF